MNVNLTIGGVIVLLAILASVHNETAAKNRYTATLVACGWAAVLEKVTRASGQEPCAQ